MVYEIIGRVTALFSATFPERLQLDAVKLLHADYAFVTVGAPSGACPDVTQIIEPINDEDKRTRLFELLKARLHVHAHILLCYCCL